MSNQIVVSVHNRLSLCQVIQISRGIEVKNGKCESRTFIIVAILCITAQLFDLILVQIQSEQFVDGDLVTSIWSSPIMLTRNILSTVVSLIASVYSAFYSWKLVMLLKQT